MSTVIPRVIRLGFFSLADIRSEIIFTLYWLGPKQRPHNYVGENHENAAVH